MWPFSKDLFNCSISAFLRYSTCLTFCNLLYLGLRIAVLGSYLYAAGGFDDSLPLKSTEKYDPETNTWNLISDMNCCRGGVGVCTMGRMVWAVGGHDGSAYLNSVEFYNTQTDTWQYVASMELGRAGAGVVSCKCNIENFGETCGMAKTAMV